MFQEKKLICFDLDGTLIDSVGIWNQIDATLIQQLSNHVVDHQIVQLQRDQQLKALKHTAEPYLEYYNFLKNLYDIPLSKEEIQQHRYAIAHYFLDHVVELKANAAQFLLELKRRNFEIALTTTTSLQNVLRYKNNNTKINQQLDFDHIFSLILTRENVENIKPDPEMYLKALKHYQLATNQCIIFEDSLIGVEAANAAGIEVVAVYDEYSIHEQQQIQSKANYFFKDYETLISLIQQ